MAKLYRTKAIKFSQTLRVLTFCGQAIFLFLHCRKVRCKMLLLKAPKSLSPKLIRHGNGAVFENALNTLKTKFEDWRRLCVFGCVRSLSKSVISQSCDDHWLLRSQIFPAYCVEGNHIWCVNFQSSLRSKRFRGVWEHRKTEEWDFRCFSRAKNGARAKKRKGGGWGRGRKEYPVPLTFFAPQPYGNACYAGYF